MIEWFWKQMNFYWMTEYDWLTNNEWMNWKISKKLNFYGLHNILDFVFSVTKKWVIVLFFVFGLNMCSHYTVKNI